MTSFASLINIIVLIKVVIVKTLNDLTLVYPSLDRGYLDRRMFVVLDRIVNCGYSALNILIYAQKYTQENREKLEAYREKIPNLEIMYVDDASFRSYPELRVHPCNYVKTEFVFLCDDDHLLPRKSQKLLDLWVEGMNTIDSDKVIKAIHYCPGGNVTEGVEVIFPHGYGSTKFLIRKEDILNESLMDDWLTIRNLDDLNFSYCMIEKGFLVAHACTSGFPIIQHSTSEDSFTSNTAAFGIPIRKRMQEFYIITANSEEKWELYRELCDKVTVDIPIFTEGTPLREFKTNNKYRARYLELKHNPNKFKIMLNEFYHSLGLEELKTY